MRAKEQSKGVGGVKKLKDYAAVPGTPPPEHGKDREVVCLERELHREKTYLSILQKENKEIEKILQELEKELNYVRSNFPQNLDGDGKIHADNEHWFKYEAQMEVNRRLERERRQLESEIKQMEEQGMINLDSLTQSELILYVKQLERTKTDLLSELRAKEWSLDKQAKDYHHLFETKRALEAEIKHYDGERAMFRHYKRIACPSASAAVSRQSSQKNSARRGRPGKDGKKPEDGGGPRKATSVSHENLAGSAASSVMFRSLDESQLRGPEGGRSPVPSHQRRLAQQGEAGTDAEKGTEPKKGTWKSTASVGSLPELPKTRSKTPPATSKTEPIRPSIQFREETFDKSSAEEARAGNGFKTVTTEPVSGSRFTITIRILGRIVSNPSAKCTINSVEAAVAPR